MSSVAEMPGISHVQSFTDRVETCKTICAPEEIIGLQRITTFLIAVFFAIPVSASRIATADRGDYVSSVESGKAHKSDQRERSVVGMNRVKAAGLSDKKICKLAGVSVTRAFQDIGQKIKPVHKGCKVTRVGTDKLEVQSSFSSSSRYPDTSLPRGYTVVGRIEPAEFSQGVEGLASLRWGKIKLQQPWSNNDSLICKGTGKSVMQFFERIGGKVKPVHENCKVTRVSTDKLEMQSSFLVENNKTPVRYTVVWQKKLNGRIGPRIQSFMLTDRKIKLHGFHKEFVPFQVFSPQANSHSRRCGEKGASRLCYP